MPIAYHPHEPLRALLSRYIMRTVLHPLFLGAIALFLIIRISVAVGMSEEGAKQIDSIFTYPATLVGTLFAFLIGFFVNNCYTRFMDNWRAAMIGWSRINDLALQVYGYVHDRTQACEVMRLMNAANHLCYGDLAGQDMIPTCRRRHLLTSDEVDLLRRPGGPPPFYICSSWALKKLQDQTKERPVDKMFVLAMDKSIVEWRQQTTLLPMIQMNPMPFPLYRNMVILLVLFEVVVAFKIALVGFTASHNTWVLLQEILIDFLLFSAISLLCTSLFLTSVWLLMPWHKDDTYDNLGATVDLPAEYFIMLPLAGHRRLFSEFGLDDCPPEDKSSSIFLQPFAIQDVGIMEEFAQTDSWRMMQILHASFRPLAPDASKRPSIQRRSSSAAIRRAIRNSREDYSKLGMSSPAIAALTEADEEGGGEESQHYHLFSTDNLSPGDPLARAPDHTKRASFRDDA